MTTTEAIARLRKCGVEGLPELIEAANAVVKAERACLSGRTPPTGRLARLNRMERAISNVVAAVEAAAGRKNG